MIVIRVKLENGFRKGDANNIPVIHSGMVCSFVTKTAAKNKQPVSGAPMFAQNDDLLIDYVQVRTTGDVCEARAIAFNKDKRIVSKQANVTIKVNLRKEEIFSAECEQCPKKDSCSHIMAFIFWLYRKSTDTDTPAIRNFWGTEAELLVESGRSEAVRIRDEVGCDDLRIEADMEVSAVTDGEGNAFLNAVLDSMFNQGLDSSLFYSHCRPDHNEFEPLFVHHTLLDSNSNKVKDVTSFLVHMEEVAKKGLFERLNEATRTSYKSHLWLESQYMRLRCSLIHRIVTRKSSADDDRIMEMLFCKDRETNCEERQQLKQHKRFILKQTEKLENKTYEDCGLILSENYPYISASPDGITDDHIVEIKAPKTEEEFEKYLEKRETIAPKYMAQIQIQMYMANVTKALYCVLSPTFDTTGALHYVWVQADMEFVAGLLGAVEDFWKDVVFPRLVKVYNLPD
ncbi:uncharacterized protein LOC119685450 [Teleopsis dalmanni]|uniref:uncharacterized protein LOC119677457 n=1 Tax=Teleopsis dalmanni TaxID=139649 RepID=UPI0018CEC272|nr:uncharacterized protein LOC119677457 [Teleopsis dalmanni]XP_037955656.1 uncharacterized protein LOC119685450 [Teleopsis dalmanni]